MLVFLLVIALFLSYSSNVAGKGFSDRLAKIVEDNVMNSQKLSAVLKKNEKLKKEKLRPRPAKVKRKLDTYAEQKEKAQKLRQNSVSLKRDLRRIG